MNANATLCFLNCIMHYVLRSSRVTRCVCVCVSYIHCSVAIRDWKKKHKKTTRVIEIVFYVVVVFCYAEIQLVDEHVDRLFWNRFCCCCSRNHNFIWHKRLGVWCRSMLSTATSRLYWLFSTCSTSAASVEYLASEDGLNTQMCLNGKEKT